MGVGTKQELKFTFFNDKEGNSVKQPSETPGNHLSEASMSSAFWFSVRYLMRYLDNKWRIGNISFSCYVCAYQCVCMCVCMCSVLLDSLLPHRM